MRVTANQKHEIASATLVKLDALANRCQVWQRDFYDKSNKGLYALLSECLGMYYEIKGSPAEVRTGHMVYTISRAHGLQSEFIPC